MLPKTDFLLCQVSGPVLLRPLELLYVLYLTILESCYLPDVKILTVVFLFDVKSV